MWRWGLALTGLLLAAVGPGDLCGGFTVTNEGPFFGDDTRRRRDPCCGRDPTSFDGP
jgi:hypothetical protein